MCFRLVITLAFSTSEFTSQIHTAPLDGRTESFRLWIFVFLLPHFASNDDAFPAWRKIFRQKLYCFCPCFHFRLHIFIIFHISRHFPIPASAWNVWKMIACTVHRSHTVRSGRNNDACCQWPVRLSLEPMLVSRYWYLQAFAFRSMQWVIVVVFFWLKWHRKSDFKLKITSKAFFFCFISLIV